MDERSKKMSWTNIFMVPLVMACATVGTIGMIKLIRRFTYKQNDSDVKTGMNEVSSNND